MLSTMPSKRVEKVVVASAVSVTDQDSRRSRPAVAGGTLMPRYRACL
jgi:hypothetical protein